MCAWCNIQCNIQCYYRCFFGSYFQSRPRKTLESANIRRDARQKRTRALQSDQILLNSGSAVFGSENRRPRPKVNRKKRSKQQVRCVAVLIGDARWSHIGNVQFQRTTAAPLIHGDIIVYTYMMIILFHVVNCGEFVNRRNCKHH